MPEQPVKKMSFSKPRVVPPPKASTKAASTPAPRLAAAGQILLTGKEREVLEAAGWRDGDPIPANLGTLMSQQRKAAQAAAPGGTLPPDAEDQFREQLAGMLQAAKVEEGKKALLQSRLIPDAGPGVNEAIRTGLMDDDLTPLPATKPGEVRPMFGPIEDLPPEVAAAVAPDLEPKPNPGAGGAEPETKCRHCGHHPQADQVVVTDDDKLRWIVSQEGHLRFEKEYSLFGGAIVVRFRSLLTSESDAIWGQLARDNRKYAQNLEPIGPEVQWRNWGLYALSLGISRVVFRGGKVETIPQFHEAEIDDLAEGETRLTRFLDAVTENVFPTESLRRALGAAHTRFGLLVEHLEAHAEDESFWKAVDTKA